jgi:predicted NUDIX family phosphoesterase
VKRTPVREHADNKADSVPCDVLHENIFCLARADLEEAGFLNGEAGGLADLLALPQYFIPRPEAEEDQSYKQVIPYQVFCCQGRIFVFRRGGGVGEQRLSGRLSIGIGGHVNDRDSDHGRMTGSTFESALLREREEELRLTGEVTTDYAGLINDDSDPVGLVHLGAVFVCRVEDSDHLSLGDDEDLYFEGWWTPEEIARQGRKFEKWSLLALGLVSGCNCDRDVRPRS